MTVFAVMQCISYICSSSPFFLLTFRLSLRGITILKKPPGPNDPPINCVKGTGVIDVPPDFIFRFILNKENATKLDPMLKQGKTRGRRPWQLMGLSLNVCVGIQRLARELSYIHIEAKVYLLQNTELACNSV